MGLSIGNNIQKGTIYNAYTISIRKVNINIRPYTAPTAKEYKKKTTQNCISLTFCSKCKATYR
jgi:hypothetical protein